MLASEAIAKLRKTELKQLSVTSVTDADVLGYLNEAVLQLHNRFDLWQDDCLVTHVADTLIYKLDGIDGNVTIDLSDKQLLVITEGFDYDGEPMSINDEDDPFGVVTPKYNWLEFPPDGIAAGEDFAFIFRAAPLDMVANTETIDLPPVLFEAMYFYVGFRAHVSQKGNKELENGTHQARYVDACDRVKALGLITAESTVSHKFSDQNYPWP